MKLLLTLLFPILCLAQTDAVNGVPNQILQTTSVGGIPLCNGFTPTNGQLFQYTTTLSPSPCLTMVISPTPQVATIAFSATPVLDMSKSVQTITLTGNVTSSSFINGSKGLFTINVCQDATGLRLFVWPPAFHGALTIGSLASKCSSQTFSSTDGVSYYAQGLINQ